MKMKSHELSSGADRILDESVSQADRLRLYISVIATYSRVICNAYASLSEMETRFHVAVYPQE